ncbi:MAG: N-acetylmuramoyl-L-alanine amidase [Candidatus Metalachnospira sp.]|nr:N-acetylmuramoyl-L-alanine amidase [Candidatus Metalachnospira sp.]
MIINVHAGHNPDGMVACGAIGLIKESTEARAVKDKLISSLRACGNTVYDCTCDDGTSKNDVLKKIVAKCNSHAADLDLSIHFNSGVDDEDGNGCSTGTEVLVYSKSGVIAEYAKSVCDRIAALGFKNRGVKVRTDLYVLNSTKAPAMLVECCFVDDKDDVKLYSADKMAMAIAEGLGFKEACEVVEKSKIIINGQEKEVERILNNGTNFIKIRDVAELLGYDVSSKGSIPVLTKK